jgi:hypothetical protein
VFDISQATILCIDKIIARARMGLYVLHADIALDALADAILGSLSAVGSFQGKESRTC